MRSSKSRSRSKSNRSRSIGNIVNRVFDSSGPEGKVRGTPQQIIDKYTQLARDATLSNDRVAAENFQQHAEHYTRMLGEAQRDQDARREQQEQANRDRQRDRHDSGSGGGGGNDQRRESQQSESLEAVDRSDSDRPEMIEDDLQSAPQPDLVIDVPGQGGAGGPDIAEAADSGLVETPESTSKPKPQSRPPRSRKPKAPKADVDRPSSGDAPAQSPAGNEGSAKVAE